MVAAMAPSYWLGTMNPPTPKPEVVEARPGTVRPRPNPEAVEITGRMRPPRPVEEATHKRRQEGEEPAPVDAPGEVRAYARETLEGAFAKTVPYLLALTARLHADFAVVYRESGPPRDPGETFGLREGSCRDVAWLMIAMLRAQGVAARFVSGYLYFAMDAPAYELHAWVEAFVPGAGWWGLDPSQGMACGSGHLPLCASAHPARTLPVEGGVRGAAAGTLSTSLVIEEAPAP